MADPEPPSRRPIVIGVAGGIASGKSYVARRLAARASVGVSNPFVTKLLDADAIARAELEREETAARVIEAFGPGVAARGGGGVDRRELAARVFGDEAAVRRLEAIVHPGVIAEIARGIEGLGRAASDEGAGSGTAAGTADKTAIAILDVPLLFESGMAGLCDEVIFVDAPIEMRRARAAATRGWSADEIARREAHQVPPAEKRARSTFTVENGGDAAATEEGIERFWRERIAPRLRPRPNP